MINNLMEISQQVLDQIYIGGDVPDNFTEEQARIIHNALFAYDLDGNFQDLQDTLEEAGMTVVF